MAVFFHEVGQAQQGETVDHCGTNNLEHGLDVLQSG